MSRTVPTVPIENLEIPDWKNCEVTKPEIGAIIGIRERQTPTNTPEFGFWGIWNGDNYYIWNSIEGRWDPLEMLVIPEEVFLSLSKYTTSFRINYSSYEWIKAPMRKIQDYGLLSKETLSKMKQSKHDILSEF